MSTAAPFTNITNESSQKSNRQPLQGKPQQEAHDDIEGDLSTVPALPNNNSGAPHSPPTDLQQAYMDADHLPGGQSHMTAHTDANSPMANLYQQMQMLPPHLQAQIIQTATQHFNQAMATQQQQHMYMHQQQMMMMHAQQQKENNYMMPPHHHEDEASSSFGSGGEFESWQSQRMAQQQHLQAQHFASGGMGFGMTPYPNNGPSRGAGNGRKNNNKKGAGSSNKFQQQHQQQFHHQMPPFDPTTVVEPTARRAVPPTVATEGNHPTSPQTTTANATDATEGHADLCDCPPCNEKRLKLLMTEAAAMRGTQPVAIDEKAILAQQEQQQAEFEQRQQRQHHHHNASSISPLSMSASGDVAIAAAYAGMSPLQGMPPADFDHHMVMHAGQEEDQQQQPTPFALPHVQVGNVQRNCSPPTSEPATDATSGLSPNAPNQPPETSEAAADALAAFRKMNAIGSNQKKKQQQPEASSSSNNNSMTRQTSDLVQAFGSRRTSPVQTQPPAPAFPAEPSEQKAVAAASSTKPQQEAKATTANKRSQQQKDEDLTTPSRGTKQQGQQQQQHNSSSRRELDMSEPATSSTPSNQRSRNNNNGSSSTNGRQQQPRSSPHHNNGGGGRTPNNGNGSSSHRAQPLEHGHRLRELAKQGAVKQAYLVQIHVVRGKRIQTVSQMEVQEGDHVIFEGDRGVDLGQAMQITPVDNEKLLQVLQQNSAPPHRGTPEVVSFATAEQVEEWQRMLASAREAIPAAQAAVAQLRLPIRILDAVYQYDREKLTFFYEAESRVDFRALLKELFCVFRCRIWMDPIEGCAAHQAQSFNNNNSGNSPSANGRQ